jgi:hypothetical protein
VNFSLVPEALMKRLIIIPALLISIFIYSGCARNWKDPDTSIAAINISIADLLSNRDIYQSSGVRVIGRVWYLTQGTVIENEDGSEDIYTTFVIADRKGTGIEVYVPGEAPINDGDFLRVVGIYRKQFQSTGDYFSNRIDAVRLETWKPSTGYWIREYEFD